MTQNMENGEILARFQLKNIDLPVDEPEIRTTPFSTFAELPPQFVGALYISVKKEVYFAYEGEEKKYFKLCTVKKGLKEHTDFFLGNKYEIV